MYTPGAGKLEMEEPAVPGHKKIIVRKSSKKIKKTLKFRRESADSKWD
jgi:hypothetical protein